MIEFPGQPYKANARHESNKIRRSISTMTYIRDETKTTFLILGHGVFSGLSEMEGRVLQRVLGEHYTVVKLEDIITPSQYYDAKFFRELAARYEFTTQECLLLDNERLPIVAAAKAGIGFLKTNPSDLGNAATSEDQAARFFQPFVEAIQAHLEIRGRTTAPPTNAGNRVEELRAS